VALPYRSVETCEAWGKGIRLDLRNGHSITIRDRGGITVQTAVHADAEEIAA
jgi:hypothetical protein